MSDKERKKVFKTSGTTQIKQYCMPEEITIRLDINNACFQPGYDFCLPVCHLQHTDHNISSVIYTGFRWENVKEKPLGRPRPIWEDKIKMDLRQHCAMTWTTLMWIRRGTGGSLL
jgi:hypothetical protein